MANKRTGLNESARPPLRGKRLVVTRARPQASALRRALEDLGATVIEIPTIEIRPPESWQPLDQAIRRLKEFDFLLATSANGVRSFLSRLAALGGTVKEIEDLKVGAIGPATAAEFMRVGIKPDFVPREFRAEGLLEALAGLDLEGKAFLIPRAKEARDVLPRVLRERGARVEVVAAYETVRPHFKPGELNRLLTPVPDGIAFTSSSTAAHFTELVAESNLRERLSLVEVYSIGPITSQTLRRLGWSVTVEAAEFSIPGLVKAIREHFETLTR